MLLEPEQTRNFENLSSFPVDSSDWWDTFDRLSWNINYEEGIAFALAGATANFLAHKKDYAYSMLYEDIRLAQGVLNLFGKRPIFTLPAA